ncbi:MAG: hypothetical protein H7834_12930 [Magnetococcus sp. YQC-9]
MSPSDRIFGLLFAAFAHRERPADACLDLERLAALSEGRLSPMRRRAALTHLARCERCYQEWSLVQEAVAMLPQPNPLLGRIKSAWRAWCSSRFQRPAYWGTLGVAMASLLLVLLPVGEPSDPLWQGMAQLRQAGVTLDPRRAWRWEAQIPQWRGPYHEAWQESVRGKAPPGTHAAMQKVAFAAGVREVLTELNATGSQWEHVKAILPDWQHRPDTLPVEVLEPARRLGIWAGMTHFGCQGSPSATFLSAMNAAWEAAASRPESESFLNGVSGENWSALAVCARAERLLNRFLGA